MYKLSIIVPIYNSEKYIEKCVESLINQDYENLEIVLVNDGSTDSSLSICESLAKIDKRIKIYSIENSGVSNARNYGISKSTGDFILFVDSDDYISPNCIEDCMKTIKRNALDILKFNYYRVTQSGINKNFEYPVKEIICNKEYKKKLYPLVFNSGNFSNVWSAIIKKELCEKVKFEKNITYGEDFMFFMNCFLQSKNIQFINNYYYYYCINDGSITNTFNEKHCIKKINDCFLTNEIIQNKLNEKGYGQSKDYLNNSKFMFENELKNVLKKCNLKFFIEFVKKIKDNEDIMNIVNLFYNDMKFPCKQLFDENRFFCILFKIRYLIRKKLLQK